jgi:hypothetical protein
MTAVEWRVGDRGRIGGAEFEVVPGPGDHPYVKWKGLWTSVLSDDLLAAMGAVRIPPPVPPTIGHPQSVRDNPPPADAAVLVWSSRHNHYIGVTVIDGDRYDWWMPQPSAPPGVES